MAKANAEVRALGRELELLAGEVRKAGSDADFELGQKSPPTASALAEAKGHVRDLRKEMRGARPRRSRACDQFRRLFTSATLYFRITTGQGGTATVDVRDRNPALRVKFPPGWPECASRRN